MLHHFFSIVRAGLSVFTDLGFWAYLACMGMMIYGGFGLLISYLDRRYERRSHDYPLTPDQCKPAAEARD